MRNLAVYGAKMRSQYEHVESHTAHRATDLGTHRKHADVLGVRDRAVRHVQRS